MPQGKSRLIVDKMKICMETPALCMTAHTRYHVRDGFQHAATSDRVQWVSLDMMPNNCGNQGISQKTLVEGNLNFNLYFTL